MSRNDLRQIFGGPAGPQVFDSQLLTTLIQGVQKQLRKVVGSCNLFRQL